jgi:hypothetical protein
VISEEYCRAYASAASLGDVLVAADNGLGFDAVQGDDGTAIWLTSEGTLYTKRQGGQEITLTCTPSATAIRLRPAAAL